MATADDDFEDGMPWKPSDFSPPRERVGGSGGSATFSAAARDYIVSRLRPEDDADAGIDGGGYGLSGKQILNGRAARRGEGEGGGEGDQEDNGNRRRDDAEKRERRLGSTRGEEVSWNGIEAAGKDGDGIIVPDDGYGEFLET